ncbi:leucine--tRNA ligase [Enterobacteriaceae endosymbiont of Donacia vulgaris]|uniref:leucine--tRNA ligase n=1 Tax=Enterobacteriaceae endosymbiont of Donacia vulgaris TaxID=2675789 RepID=UPI001448F08F|nr:leucine--tRNA ligase [Enterobacteriaceae endosymbiont of Donacia vulgaris]QJC36994.1 leucine--tRNA ligase [Enterobacteriaceae endosymbiont of Donacia vulgaris]
MKKEYFPKEIEFYVQKKWEHEKTFDVIENYNKKKFYCLSMLPYPSGKLHMGHVRNYTIGDVIARYQRMLGKNVLHPIGWDAFGLPAEIAAHNHNISPNIWTKNNILYMKKQLQLLGFSFNWDREITTCDPNYYRWEQWFFLKLYKLGLAYKKNDIVNWCNTDKTILANEQVINKCCWRCNSIVTKKQVQQWFLKITNYAEELLNNLKFLHGWPKKVKNMQKNWIGQIKGIEVIFKIYNINYKFSVFIEKKDYYIINNISFIKILYSHSICKKFINNQKIKKFINKYSSALYLENNNFQFNKIKYINSELFAYNTFLKKKIPIIIVNYLSNYSNIKATISNPQYNKKDCDFIHEYNMSIISKNKILNLSNNIKNNHELIIKSLILKKKAFYKKFFNLKDWSISRQRIWGTPIPIIITKDKQYIPLKQKNLPFVFPEKFFNTNIKDNYSEKIKNNLDWFKYNNNGVIGQLETDTFDTFIESSWYYARYTCTNEKNRMINKKQAQYWLPIDQYIGGIEHATMHLIYFRFFHKLMRDIGLLNTNEPVKNLLCQGMVLANSYYYIDKKKKYHWVKEKNVFFDKKNNIFIDKKGRKLINNGMIKMSKSKNNGINPQKIIEKYGADSLRLFIMFAAPPTIDLEWQETGIKGMYRFLNKLWIFIYEYKKLFDNYQKLKNNKLFFHNTKQLVIQDYINKTITKVTNIFEHNQSFNTAISSIMILFNKIRKYKIFNDIDHTIIFNGILSILKMLYPFTPHICFVLWKYMGNKNDIDYESWPLIIKIDTKKINNKFNIVIQINGKKKYILSILDKYKDQQNYIKKYVLSHNKISKLLINVEIIKIIYIPQKIFNIVTTIKT